MVDIRCLDLVYELESIRMRQQAHRHETTLPLRSLPRACAAGARNLERWELVLEHIT
jgi:hypothetical protein